MIFSKIKERAKKEEIKAKIVVRIIVAPIVEYLITSKLGQRDIISLLTPEQNKKKLEIELNFDILKFNLNICNVFIYKNIIELYFNQLLVMGVFLNFSNIFSSFLTLI